VRFDSASQGALGDLIYGPQTPKCNNARSVASRVVWNSMSEHQ
jgi:hypothetical protein